MRGLLDVNRVPLVAIDCATMGMRRYVGRECSHDAKLEGAENGTINDIRDTIELFRTEPARALGRSSPASYQFDQPVPA